jgi:hypothetical protein
LLRCLILTWHSVQLTAYSYLSQYLQADGPIDVSTSPPMPERGQLWLNAPLNRVAFGSGYRLPRAAECSPTRVKNRLTTPCVAPLHVNQHPQIDGAPFFKMSATICAAGDYGALLRNVRPPQEVHQSPHDAKNPVGSQETDQALT